MAVLFGSIFIGSTPIISLLFNFKFNNFKFNNFKGLIVQLVVFWIANPITVVRIYFKP